MKALFPRGFRYSSAFLGRSGVGQQLSRRSFAAAESSKQQPPLKANTERQNTSQSKSDIQGQKSGSGGSSSASGGGGAGRGGIYFAILAAGGAGAAYYYADELGLSKHIENLMGKPAPADDMKQKKQQQKTAPSSTEQASQPASASQTESASKKSSTASGGTSSEKTKADMEKEKKNLKTALSLAEKAIEKEKQREKEEAKKTASSSVQVSSSASSRSEEKKESASTQQATTDQKGSGHSDTGADRNQSQTEQAAGEESKQESKSSSETTNQDYTTEHIAEELRKDLVSRTRNNIQNMSENELRERVLLLTEELSERSKWEAIRINEFLRAQEDKWHQRFAEFAEEQRQALASELEEEKSKLLKQLEQQNNEWRNSELQRMSHEVEQVAQSQLGKLLQQVKDHDAKQTQDRLRTLEHLKGKMEGLSEGLEEYHHYNVLSNNIHRIATSSLHLLQAFEYGKKKPLTDEIAAIEVAGKRDDAISLAIQMMPSCVHSPKGPPTRQELFTRLRRVLRAGEAAALTPHNSGLVGHAVGSVTSGLLYKQEDEHVTYTGPSLPSDGFISPYVESAREKIGDVFNRAWDSTKDAASKLVPTSAEANSESSQVSKQREWSKVFEEATQALHDNDLGGAVRALDRLEGYPALVVKDWKEEARERLRIEHSMRIIRAETTCLTVSMY